MIKLFAFLFEEALESPGLSGAGLSGELCLLNHSSFCRRAAVSSTGCALALDLSLGCKPANAGDMEDPELDSSDTELSSVSNLHSQEIHR